MRLCLESVLVTPDAMDTQQPVVRSPRVDGLDQTERPRLDHLVSEAARRENRWTLTRGVTNPLGRPLATSRGMLTTLPVTNHFSVIFYHLTAHSLRKTNAQPCSCTRGLGSTAGVDPRV